MHVENPITKLTQVLNRPDGSQARIVAQVFFGAGLHRSVGVYVHRRDNPDVPWILCSDRPHPEWKQMPLDEYKKRGRSEMLRTGTRAGQELRTCSATSAAVEPSGLSQRCSGASPRPVLTMRSRSRVSML